MISKGDKVYYYKINLDENGKKKVEQEVYDVIAAKDSQIYDKIAVLDDNYYTRIQTKIETNTVNPILNKAHCHEWVWKGLPDEVNCYIYSTCSDSKKMFLKLYKEIEKYSKKKCKKYNQYIDTSKIESEVM